MTVNTVDKKNKNDKEHDFNKDQACCTYDNWDGEVVPP